MLMTGTMTMQREVLVKINALVEEGVAPLVAAMSEIPGLVILESNQGEPGRRPAHLAFRLGDWRQTGELLFEQLTSAIPPDLRAMVTLRLQAYDVGRAVGSITVDPAAVAALGNAVRRFVWSDQPPAELEAPLEATGIRN
jgi:hypothetical protein